MSKADTYLNDKVVYAFDYADFDDNVDVANDDNSHGTHVAGIAAGYLADEEGVVEFSGVAPQAQLAIMKVFSDDSDGASEATILAALEDCVYLGVDVINMSLGSKCGFTYDGNEVEAAVYKRVEDAGIILMNAAGNDNNAAYYNNDGYDMARASDPDMGVVGSASTYPYTTSVASVDNAYVYNFVLTAGGRDITMTNKGIAMNTIAGDYEYVVVPGVGEAADFEGLDVNGKVALIQRGAINFTSKILNAEANGAIAAVIYDNVDGSLVNMDLSDADIHIPAAFISLADGEYMAALEEKIVTINADRKWGVNSTAYLMSDFSSLGCTPDLKIKPEITAPGGSIFSAVPNEYGEYDVYSGTSMAAPHMAGAAAQVKQYLNENYPELSEREKGELTAQLLMSTSTPLYDEYGVEYTPRKQGSGLADVGAAIATDVYLSIEPDEDGNTRPKVDLGDDPDCTGIYTIRFLANNLSGEEKEYTLDVSCLSPYIASDGERLYFYGEYDEFNEFIIIDAPETVIVPANGSVEVEVTIQVTDGYYLYAENGSYVEGFVYLENDEDPALSIPYMGFYGDWTQAPAIDYSTVYDDTDDFVIYPSTIQGTILEDHFVDLGVNLFGDGEIAFADKRYVSPNGDGYLDALAYITPGLLRNAKSVTYTITDSETDEVYFEYVSEYNMKTTYWPDYGQVIPYTWFEDFLGYTGTDANGDILPSGTRLNARAKVELDYDKHESNNLNDTLEFDFVVDTEAPEITDLSIETGEEGEVYLRIQFADDNELAAVYLCDEQWNTIDGQTYETTDKVKNNQLILRIDNYPYDAINLALLDYACNENDFSITLVEKPEPEFNFPQENYLLEKGSSADLGLIMKEFPEDAEVSFATSNSWVASVNENGVVTGLSTGNATITATCGNYTASCEVAVVTVSNNSGAISLDPEGTFQAINSFSGILFFDLSKYDPIWSSSDEAVAVVDENGCITAVAPGFATVTFTAGNYTANWEVTVNDSAEKPEILLGDIDGDGDIDQDDYDLLSDYLWDWSGNTQIVQENADIDGDGYITLFDLGALKKLLRS